MTFKAVRAGLGLALSSCLLVNCGSGTPAQPATAPTVAPTPVATPVPKPLSVIPGCFLGPIKPVSSECQSPDGTNRKPSSRFESAVNAAIDRAITERTDLFDLADVNGGPRVLNVDAYMIAVVAALGEAGLCGKIDPEGEIGVKGDDNLNEQWIVVSRAGWGTATGNWVQRKYVGACSPSTF